MTQEAQEEGCSCRSHGEGVHCCHDYEYDWVEGVLVREFDFDAGNGALLHVRFWGDPREQPLVLLHGFMQSSRVWDFLGPELADDHHCVLAIDLVGHGASACPDNASCYDFNALILQVTRFVDQIACLDPITGNRRKAHLLGYSLGGRVALHVALRHPELVSALVLESSGIGPANEDERIAAKERNEAWARRLREKGIEDFISYWEGLPLFATQHERKLDDLQRPARLANDAEAMALIAERAGKHCMPLASEAMDALDATWLPVLYVCGEDDPVGAATGHALAERGYETSCAATGHNVHLEAPMLYLRIVQDFLAANELRGQWRLSFE